MLYNGCVSTKTFVHIALLIVLAGIVFGVATIVTRDDSPQVVKHRGCSGDFWERSADC